MVVMTDGENDVLSNGNQINSLNGTWYSAYGRGKKTTLNRFGTTNSPGTSAAPNDNMIDLCNNTKEKGVTTYTVASRMNSSTVQNRLRSCASTTAHYSYAADGVALASAFDHAGESIANTNSVGLRGYSAAAIFQMEQTSNLRVFGCDIDHIAFNPDKLYV